MPALNLPLHSNDALVVSGPAPGLAMFLLPPNAPELVARLGQEKVLLHQADCMVLEGERYGSRDGGVCIGRRYLALDAPSGTPIGALNVTIKKQGRKTTAIASNVVVAEAFRRQGIASSLVKRALEDFPKMGLDNTMTTDGAALFGRSTESAVVPLLVIVHPGSACGSAEANLGRDCADYQRLEMQATVADWDGAVVVIDGDLSDELDGWRGSWKEWGQTVAKAVERAKDNGLLSLRVMGNDASEYNQQDAIRDVVKDHGLTPANTVITLTGAWVEDSGDGCVHSVREVLEELGFSPTLESPMDLDFSLETEDDFDEDEDEEMEEEPAPAPVARPRFR